ncbi:hypothetical protein [Micromonospora sp. NPDC047738]|uniref:hypothetical protein n=1 Tax=unclassified Micromonospora TaxID=2617518 RepID=UPI0033C63D4E
MRWSTACAAGGVPHRRSAWSGTTPQWRARLVAGYDRRSWAPAVTLDDLLALLAAGGVEVELR